MSSIDLNCDMGEIPQAIADGTQESLMPSFTSINVACGGHAGNQNTMRTTIQQALRYKLAVGAHPGYPDRENFGRLELGLSPAEIAETVFEQLRALAEIASELGVALTHVKPHGALYNQAVHNRQLAQAIAEGVARYRRNIVLVGLADSPMLDVYRRAGFPVAAEAFADRLYEPDGTLRSRKHDDALIRDPQKAAAQALSIARDGIIVCRDGSRVPAHAQTICIHGDTAGAHAIASVVSKTLRNSGITLSPLLPAQQA